MSFKYIINIIIILATVFSVSAQQFVELDSVAKTHKFPILQYPEKPNVEEKVNTIMQLLYQELYPEVFGGEPIESVLEDTEGTDYSFQVHSWKQFSLHPNIFDIRLTGSEDGLSYERTETFDTRTGTHFKLWSLYTDEGADFVDRKIKNKITDLTEKETLDPSTESIGVNYQFEENHLAFLINKLEDEKLLISYEELKPYLISYGKNLLLKSDIIVHNPSMEMKLLKGVGGFADNQNVKCTIFISKINKDGEANVYRWSDNHIDRAELYSISTIKNGVLQADDYVFDSLSGKKEHLMYSLHLEKKEDTLWEGTLQLGSPFYPMVFIEN